MKRMILGTTLGRVALSIRESISAVGAAYARPEIAGMIANDRLSAILATKLCREGKTFIDVGAHLGSIVSEVMHSCPTAKIIAFEAIPEKVAHLRKNFPNVEFHGCALADSEGEATFFIDSTQSGFSSLVRPPDAGKPHVIEIKVPLKKLDNLVSSSEVDVIKIDVERAELGVLRGGERLVAQSRPTIMFESGPPSDDGLVDPKEALWQWFDERDYAVLVPNRVAHKDPGLGRDCFLESHIFPRRTTNYFAVAKERRIELRDRSRVVLKLGPGEPWTLP